MQYNCKYLLISNESIINKWFCSVTWSILVKYSSKATETQLLVKIQASGALLGPTTSSVVLVCTWCRILYIFVLFVFKKKILSVSVWILWIEKAWSLKLCWCSMPIVNHMRGLGFYSFIWLKLMIQRLQHANLAF